MTDLTWKTIDPDTLPAEHAKMYNAYKAAYKVASDARKAFEARMNKDARLPDGKNLVFSYRFGQLGMAVGDTKKKTTSGSKLSLAAYLEHVNV